MTNKIEEIIKESSSLRHNRQKNYPKIAFIFLERTSKSEVFYMAASFLNPHVLAYGNAKHIDR